MRRILFATLVAALVLALFALVGCSGPSSSGTGGSGSASSGGSQSSSGGASTSGGAAGGNAVTIANFAFSPASITVKTGGKVTWTNNDSVTHTVTANDNSFDSGQLAPGSSFSQTFTKAGTYAYHCSIHPQMTGTVTVQ